MVDFTSKFSHFLIVIGLCLVLWLLGYGYLGHERASLRDQELAAHTRAQLIAWKAVNNSHFSGMQTYFDTYVMRKPDVLDLLRTARDGSEAQAAIARVRLYRIFYPIYRQLQQRGIRQIQFHTPDNRSFLRLNSPHLFGDSLAASRPSVVLANREKKNVQGFETGSTIAGFRNVFPIMDHRTHLGSIEFSQPFEALREAMHHLDRQKEFILLFNGPPLLPKLFDEFKKLYFPSPIHPDWLEEDPRHELPDSPPPLSPKMQAIYTGLAASTEFQAVLRGGEPASIVINGAEPVKVTLLPLIDLERKLAAVLLSFSPAPEIAELDRRHFFQLSLFSVILLIGGTTLYLFLRSTQVIEEKQKFLDLITNTMDEGLYVIDGRGIITYANACAVRILGYTGDELIGADAHALFHKHGIAGTRALADCPIYQGLQKGENYRGEEQFVRKNGSTFVAEIASQPIIWRGEWTASVTVFRDISGRKALEAELLASKQQLDAFFSQALDGFFFMMLDQPVDWQGSRDKEALLEEIFVRQRITRVNEAMLQQYRAAAEKLLGRTPADIFAHDPAQGRMLWRRFFDAGHLHVEMEERRLDGSPFWSEGDYICLYDGEGRITGQFGIQRDVSERKQMEKELLHLSNTDPLTSAYNRRYFLQALEGEMHRSQRYGTPFSLLMLDLDHFKAINDTYGHETGDLVLKKVIAFIQGRIRTTDILARWGGEEFIILLVNTPLDSAIPLVEDLRVKIAELPLGQVRTVTVSIGLTANREEDSMDSLLNRADALVYEAKAAGRNILRTAA